MPKVYSEVVMTYTKKDTEIVQHTSTESRARYGEKEIDEIRKEFIDKFNEEEYPKSAIFSHSKG